MTDAQATAEAQSGANETEILARLRALEAEGDEPCFAASVVRRSLEREIEFRERAERAEAALAAATSHAPEYAGAPREVWPGRPTIGFANWWCYNAPRTSEPFEVAKEAWRTALRFGHITEREQAEFEREHPEAALTRGSKRFARFAAFARSVADGVRIASDQTCLR